MTGNIYSTNKRMNGKRRIIKNQLHMDISTHYPIGDGPIDESIKTYEKDLQDRSESTFCKLEEECPWGEPAEEETSYDQFEAISHSRLGEYVLDIDYDGVDFLGEAIYHTNSRMILNQFCNKQAEIFYKIPGLLNIECSINRVEEEIPHEKKKKLEHYFSCIKRILIKDDNGSKEE
jgi:hypothetical protein